jgi:hypothetical protein
MEYHHKGLPAPKKFKTNGSAGKVMFTVFWNSEGVVLTDFLQKGATVNSECYIITLKYLIKKIMRKGAEIDKILLQQDNARPRTSVTTIPLPEVKAAVSQLFWDKEKYFFKDGIKKLVK